METRTATCTNIAHEVHWEDFLWALGTLCHLREMPFDGELFIRRVPPPYTVTQLVSALSAHGIAVRQATIAALRGSVEFPCVAFQRAERSGPVDPPHRIALIARCDQRRVLAVNSLSRGAFAVPFALLNETFEPLVFLPG